MVEAITEESPDAARRILTRLKSAGPFAPAGNCPRSMETSMALSRDPLDELIEQLERTIPAAAETGWVCDMPPVAHIQFAFAEIPYG